MLFVIIRLFTVCKILNTYSQLIFFWGAFGFCKIISNRQTRDFVYDFLYSRGVTAVASLEAIKNGYSHRRPII